MPGNNYIITITNATPVLAFSGSKDGASQGNFIGRDDLPDFNRFCLNVPLGPGGLSNIRWQYCQTGELGATVLKEPFWVDNPVFPQIPDTFKNNDCLIILNTTDTPALLSVIQEDVIQFKGTVVSNASVAAKDIIFVKFTANAAPQFTDKPCCVHPETMVQTVAGQRMIKDLKKGDVVIAGNGEAIPISFNIKGVMSKNFVNIPADSLGKNVPSRDLIIKEEHPILYNGKEIEPRKLMKQDAGLKLSNVTLKKAEHVWSLCTKDRRFVMMNNVPVCTWSEKGWKEMTEENPSMFWTSQ